MVHTAKNMFRMGRRREYVHVACYEGVLGTSLDLRITGKTENAGPAAECRVLEEIDRLDAIFSTYRTDSEFMQWQRTQDVAVSVSHDLASVLAEAEYWRAASNGAFLPVVEEWTRYWRQRECGHCNRDNPQIDIASPLWVIDLKRSGATRLTRHAASLDAIAKGYIIDRAVDKAIEGHEVLSVLVNIGGDLKHCGAGSMTVSVSDPRMPAENGSPLCTLRISNQAVATSGGYRRGFLIEGESYSHIFDPRLGKPIETLKSSSVIAPTAMQADIFATIVGVLSPNDGLAFADRFQSVGVLTVDDVGDCHRNKFWNRFQLPSPPPR